MGAEGYGGLGVVEVTTIESEVEGVFIGDFLLLAGCLILGVLQHNGSRCFSDGEMSRLLGVTLGLLQTKTSSNSSFLPHMC